MSKNNHNKSTSHPVTRPIASGVSASAAGEMPAPSGTTIQGKSVSSGAPPCNTAPANCINTEPVSIIGFGVDSLYLSYPGQISLESELKLRALKETAQSRNPLDKALSVFALDKHRFEVLGKGAGYYPYVLVDNAYRIKISSSTARQLPLAYIQISSAWLLAHGIEYVVSELDKIMIGLGTVENDAQVSRSDIYVDFTTIDSLENIGLNHWVTRAKSIHKYSMHREFTGYSVGLGGDIAARLYDKTAEIKESKKEYLWDIWTKRGWNPLEKVYRLEFQFERKTLTDHDVYTVPKLLKSLGQLWRYATCHWLRLTIPSQTDSTQSRWTLHPLWDALTRVEWPNTLEGVSMPVRTTREPGRKFLYENGLSGITSLMACEGISDPFIAFDTYYDNAKAYHNERATFTGTDFEGYLQEKAALKAKRYNLPYPEVDERLKEKVTPAYAQEYRKRKDGE